MAAADHQSTSSWRQRLGQHVRTLTSPPRVTGLDVARSLAVIGMIGVHVAYIPDPLWQDPSTWTGVFYGRSAILFAVLAGISIALISGGARGVAGAGLDIRRVRLQLVGRGIVIFVVGVVLESLGTTVAVILGVYGLLFVTAAVFVGWSRRRLSVVATALALAGPAAMVVLAALSVGTEGDALNLLLYSSYPPLVWLVFVMMGLIVGRSDVRALRTAVITTATGAALAVVGYGLGAWLSLSPTELARFNEQEISEESYGAAVRDMLSVQTFRADAFSSFPHSGGTGEIVGSGGVALLVIGVCLLIFRFGVPRRAAFPLAALGAMPLTAYAAHIVVIRILVTPDDYLESDAVWLLLAGGLLIACTVWAALGGRGPLERLTGRAANALAGPRSTTAPGGPPRSR